MDIKHLERIAARMRGRMVEISNHCRTSHLGGSLSCADILAAAYWHVLQLNPKKPQDPNRDRFILSKGHAASALFVALSMRGYFPDSLLDTHGQAGSPLEEHPGPGCVPGVEAATGSLGHGLAIGTGLALAARLRKRSYRVMVLCSDGECNEGSHWEAAMFAAGQRLDNLMVVVDFNKWQATGRSCDVMAIDPLADKFRAFGWSTVEVNGHNMSEVVDALSNFPDGSGSPQAVVAHTVKGKGVSFMEDDNNWHYRIPTTEEVTLSKEELGLI